MVNGAHPPGAGNGPPLGVRNRDHRDRGKGREDHLALRQVEPAMERGDEWYRLTGKQRERIIIEMKVQQIKIMSPLANSLDHGHMQRIGVADRAVQTQCLRKTCLRLSRPHFAGEGCRSGDLDSQDCGVPLKIAAKIDAVDRDYFESEIRKLLTLPDVEYIGEISDSEKSSFLSGAIALVATVSR